MFAHLLPNNFDFDNPQSKNIILDMWYDAALPARDTSRRPGRANLRPLERWMFELKTIHAGCQYIRAQDDPCRLPVLQVGTRA